MAGALCLRDDSSMFVHGLCWVVAAKGEQNELAYREGNALAARLHGYTFASHGIRLPASPDGFIQQADGNS
jgi:hypothetical protein